MLSLTLIIFISAIVLLFAQEFTLFTRKLADIPSIKLLVPLAFASWITVIFEDWISWLLLYAQVKLNNLIQYISGILPFVTGAMDLVSIVLLCFMACLPVTVFWFDARRRGLYDIPVVSYYLSALLWSLASFLLIVQPR